MLVTEAKLIALLQTAKTHFKASKAMDKPRVFVVNTGFYWGFNRKIRALHLKTGLC